MKSLLFVMTITLAGQVVASTTAEDCKPKVDKARTTLLELMAGKITPEQQAIVKESANLANACILDLKAPAGKEAKLVDLKKVWGEFKTTRENELVPLIVAGKKDEAKAIGTGIQSERMGKIKSLIQQLGE